MKITKQARQDAKHLFRSCLVADRLDEERVRQVVHAVIARKPRAYLAVLAHFERLLRLEVNRRTARVDSVGPLDPALQARMQTALQKQYGGGLVFSFRQEAGLIGGLRVRVGSDVYDGSIRARLNQLLESL
jgi:F-type H+-transporting ATPase subunit delta